MTSRMSKKSSKRHKKYRIVNIRGCNGSGKSWIIRQLMKETNAKPIYEQPKTGKLIGRIIAYKGIYKNDPVFFIGSYEIMSGGADHVMKHFGGIEDVCELVRRFAGKGHVFFEGFIISGLFQRFYDLSQELGGITWCYIDTPLKVCYQRIEARNKDKTAASGRIRGSCGTLHVEKKFISTERTRQKFKDAGEETVIINYRKPMRDIRRVLER